MEKKPSQHKRQFVPNAFKFLLAVGSMAGTLGIWNLLANKDLQVNAQNNVTVQPATNNTLAPLPTLVPLAKVEISASGVTVSQPTASLPLREVTQPPASTGASTNNNPVIIQANPSNNPAPVTTTRSSRP
jgi:hypothetical protein